MGHTRGFAASIAACALLCLGITNAQADELTVLDAGVNSVSGWLVIGLIYFWHRRTSKDYAGESKKKSALSALKVSAIWPACVIVIAAIGNTFSEQDSPQKLQQIAAQKQAEAAKRQAETDEALKSDAKWACKLYVEKSLKAPSTADFQNHTQFSAVGNGNGPYVVRGYVDAQNSFGAKVRTEFACQLRKVGENWLLDDLKTNS